MADMDVSFEDGNGLRLSFSVSDPNPNVCMEQVVKFLKTIPINETPPKESAPEE